jgi:predicted HicB family RNase H-like nuclease
MKPMQYKGYLAEVELDTEDNILVGRVVNASDVISFHAETPKSLQGEFETAIDDYLSYCEKRSISPNKPFNGKFQVRADSELHKDLYETAVKQGEKMNDLAIDLLREGLSRRKSSV